MVTPVRDVWSMQAYEFTTFLNALTQETQETQEYNKPNNPRHKHITVNTSKMTVEEIMKAQRYHG